MALGGVLIGSTIASDDAIATPIRRVDTPPIGASRSFIAPPASARIGTRRLAVAVCEMKFAIT